MRLAELEPHWVSHAGREKAGVTFRCPCGCGGYQFVPFRNPIGGDGGISWADGINTWERRGEDFDTLVTSPSILSNKEKGGCGWHGFIGGSDGSRPGEVVTC